MGGEDGAGGLYSDVWNSSDGITWNQVTAAAPWGKKCTVFAFVLNDKLWIFGGYSVKLSGNQDIWSSSDGVTWTKELDNVEWLKRFYEDAILINNKIWVLGGCGATDGLNDIWQTPDGKNWTNTAASSEWSGRSCHSVAYYNNKLWVISGMTTEYIKDVWYYALPTSITNSGKPVAPEAPVIVNMIRSDQPGVPIVIQYSTAITRAIKIGIYSCKGQEIQALWNGVQTAGVHTVTWNSADAGNKTIAGGTYLVRFETDAGDVTRTIIIGK